MSAEYEIINLQPQDFDTGGELWALAGERRAAEWRDELLHGRRIIFVYAVNGEYVASGALVFYKSDLHYTLPGRRVFLTQLLVKPAWRNQGIAGILVDALCAQAAALGFWEVSVGVDADNYAARHLFAKKHFDTVLYMADDPLGRYLKLMKTL